MAGPAAVVAASPEAVAGGIALIGGPAAALIAAAGAEALYAWYDPDFFTQGLWVHAGADATVATLNNYFQDLWRSATEAGLPSSDPIMRTLDRDMSGFVAFKNRYDSGIFRRAVDPLAEITVFGQNLGWGAQAEFNAELREIWIPRFEADFAQVVAADPRIREALLDRGVDVPSLAKRSAAVPPSGGLGWQFWAGAAAVIGLIGTGIYIARR